MALTALPFDADEMLQGLRPWIECESPTWNVRAVNRMLRMAARDLAVMGARTGANGIPTLDGLGAEGRDYHTLEERIEVEGLSRRGGLMAGLLATLGS